MVQCVQNHTPAIMVIDEIGRAMEVDAARTCKQRGVRMIASAHGDLRKLIKNGKLNGLVGGLQTVTLGDAAAKEKSKAHGGRSVSKLQAERAGTPTFEIVVELGLRCGEHHQWRVVADVARAVDSVLEGQQFNAQLRTRDPSTGTVCLKLERA